eukprot:NODE_1811_length_731_cov_95.488411_g1761_i0.p1 GENE.NODE_1811_length_731_cov_95.488411_g1761_i0~~NODE_1811_length_731_cov_95.488411_g1761_i0.p1  ORF type:complete len:173 (-),score=16.40 NODE_1811_length_731_cov_95.488411_g1761_i0:128-646(-)
MSNQAAHPQQGRSWSPRELRQGHPAFTDRYGHHLDANVLNYSLAAWILNRQPGCYRSSEVEQLKYFLASEQNYRPLGGDRLAVETQAEKTILGYLKGQPKQFGNAELAKVQGYKYLLVQLHENPDWVPARFLDDFHEVLLLLQEQAQREPGFGMSLPTEDSTGVFRDTFGTL